MKFGQSFRLSAVTLKYRGLMPALGQGLVAA